VPSIVATVWDVADEPARRLVERLYRLRPGRANDQALRLAQLRLIGDLRAGRVLVETAAGPVRLPEHPLFWAGFVLLGEP
jgi:CHAT domain-containing protein